MELLAPNRNLQRDNIRQVEEIYPELHGWGRAVALNESGLPGDPLEVWLVKNGMQGSIGLSISELYPLVDVPVRTIISADGGVTRRADAAIVDLALASPILNRTSMVGGSKGVALYPIGTPDATLTKAAKALGGIYSPLAVADVAVMSGCLAVYDFVQGADPNVLYDKSGNNRHGTLGGIAKPRWLNRKGLLHFRVDKSVISLPAAALVGGNAAYTVVSSQMLSSKVEYAFAHAWGYATSDSGRACPSAMIKAGVSIVPELRTGGDDLTLTGVVGMLPNAVEWSYNPTGTVLSGIINGDYTARQSKTLGAALAAFPSGAYIGAYGASLANAFTGPIFGWASFNRVLTDLESWIVAKVLSPPINNDLLVFDGNSLTYGIATDSYPHKLIYGMTTRPEWVNFGVAGQTTTQMSADFDAQVAPMFNASRGSQILIAWEIGNDIVLNGTDPTVAHTNFKNYCLHARSVLPASARIVVVNLTPRATVGFNTARATANALMAAQWESYADALVDVAANEFIGPDGAENNTTYFNADKIHLTAAGYAIVANLVAAAIATL